MPWQLIYTSAPRGLLSGQSGFCTVARSADLREALVQRLEQLSSYHYLRVAEAASAGRNPTISACRLLDLRGTKYHVLTRIQPCGLDFTARTNHLAHHLVFQPDELAQLPSPAAILRHWPGWMRSWQGEPRLLEEIAAGDFAACAKTFLPAQTWLRLTGNAGRAAGLLESEYIRGCYLVGPSGGEEQVLEMFCETLQLLNLNGQYAPRPWRHPFTTFLQAEDNPSDFQWRACQEGTPAYQQAVQRSIPLQKLASVRVPENSLVKPAREGLKPPPSPASPPSPGLRRLPSERRSSPPRPAPLPRQQPKTPPQSSNLSLIKVYAAFKLRTFMLRQWFSNQSGTSRASLGIFVAALLGLAAMNYWRHHSSSEEVPSASPLPLAPAAGDPGGPAAAPATSTPPVVVKAEPPDPKRLDWLPGDVRTFVFVTSNLTQFGLPINSIIPFQNLIHRLNSLDLLTKDIMLSVNTNEWGCQREAPMSVNLQNHQLSAQTDSGVSFSFNYADALDQAKPVVFQTAFAKQPAAFSIQFQFSPSTNGLPFRLLIVGENNCPSPMLMSQRWLNPTGHSLAASLPDSLGQRLIGSFTFLQGQEWQLLPFVRTAQQTNYLYQNWPAAYAPSDASDLDFVAVKNRLMSQKKTFETEILKASAETDALKNAGDYPLGTDLLQLTNEMASLTKWTDAHPTQDLFISYLGELQKQAATNANSGWIKEWPKLDKGDRKETLYLKFKKLNDLWLQNVPGAPNNLVFAETNYFSATWRDLGRLESARQKLEHERLQVDDVQKLINQMPNTLDQTAFVGLFIVDPKQARPALEMIRFESP